VVVIGEVVRLRELLAEGLMSEPTGRGDARTEERGTSDEGRRRLQAPRLRAGSRA
jgi:hypothetical protein